MPGFADRLGYPIASERAKAKFLEVGFGRFDEQVNRFQLLLAGLL